MGLGSLFLGPIGWIAEIGSKLLDPIGNIVKSLADAKVQLANAHNDEERIHAQERVTILQNKANLMIAEAPYTRLNVIIRTAMAAIPTILIAKIMLWDKAFGQWTGGHTDALDPNLWKIVFMCYGFYFLTDVSRLVTGIWSK
jgi:hypothetical protein